MKKKQTKNQFSLIHLKFSSLQYHFNEISHFKHQAQCYWNI